MAKNGKRQADEWQRLNEIFEAAVELSSADQKVFLDRKCAGDGKLRAEAERLLDAAERIRQDDFLSEDAFRVGARVISHESGHRTDEGLQVGKFRIVSEIAHGGMGTVYLADRDDFKQSVALKLIRHGLDSAEILRRFRIERDVLASLSHPNIARLLDGGTTDDGRPFLAIEYVEGERIDRYCDTHKLDLNARLRLFRQVCAAVAYAHQHLTVHRDLKPSNILVTPDGEPKLLDFGIAKILAATGLADETAAADRLLTPEYASPEQLRGEKISTASDIYSLGVLLYELLTGRRPFEVKNQSAFEIVEAVCDREPPAPSSRGVTDPADGSKPLIPAAQLKGDLDNIIVTALRKDPASRYASVEQLSDDIRRYLEGLPVTARPATFKYRAGKFVRRNRVAVASASIAIAALIAGAATASWQAVVARSEKSRAEKRFNEVRSLANKFVSDWHEGIREDGISPEIRGRLADISSEYLTRLATESEDPGILREAADAHIKLGHVYAYFMIDNEKARRSLLAAQQLSRRLLENNAADKAARSLLIQSLSKYDEFFGLEDLEAVAQRKLEQIDLREKNIADDPNDIAEMRHLALAHELLGWPLVQLGRPDEAREHYRRSDELHRQRIELLEAQPPTSKDLARLSYSLTDRASNLAYNLGEPAPSIEPMRRAFAVAKEALSMPDADRTARMAVIDSGHELGVMLRRAAHDHEGSITQLREVIAFNRSFDENNRDGYFKRREVDSLLEIATSQHALGRNAEAAASIREVFQLSRAWVIHESARNSARTYAGHAFILEIGARLLGLAGYTDQAAKAFDEAEQYLDRIPTDSRQRSAAGPGLALLMISRGDLYAGLLRCRPDLYETDLDLACVERALTQSREGRNRSAASYRRSIELIQGLPPAITRTHADLRSIQAASARLRLLGH